MTSAQDEKFATFNCSFGWIGLRTYQHPCKMENKIKTDFKVVEGEGMTWIHLSQDEDQERALVFAVMTLRVL